MRLRSNQRCPIHRFLYRCGRKALPEEKRNREMGVRRVDDPQHPREYRELQ